MGTGAAMLTVLAVGLQANGSETSSGRKPAQTPEGVASAPGAGYDAVAAPRDSAPGVAGVVMASADAVLPCSRSVVLLGTGDDTGTLRLASADRRRPAAGTLMAPLAALVPSSPYGLRMNPITDHREIPLGLGLRGSLRNTRPCGRCRGSAGSGVASRGRWQPGGSRPRQRPDHNVQPS